MELTKEEKRIFLHLTGADNIKNDPLWRNYANLDSSDPLMKSLESKKLVKCTPVEGFAANAMWSATPKGKKLAKALWFEAFGSKVIRNLRKKLERANNKLFDEGFPDFPEYERID